MSDDAPKTALTASELVDRLMPKRGPGRPTLLTKEVQRDIVAKILVGRFAWVAAASAGIPPQTYYRWMNRGEREYMEHDLLVRAREELDEPPSEPLPELTAYAEFWFEVTRARATARGTVEVQAAKEDPIKWLTMGPGRSGGPDGKEGWTANTKVELTGKDGGPVAVAALSMTLDPKRLSQADLDTLEAIATRASLPDGNQG